MSAARQPGDLIDGRYRLEERLAQTRFSSVYRGSQLSTGQPVAIKMLELGRQKGEDRRQLERRFKREMTIYGEVRHPNLVRLLDRGSCGDSLFLVLEFIDGTSLGRLIRAEGQLAPFTAKHLMTQCLDALSAGHQRGIVHRDFKPGNVMVTSTGTERQAVVLDFGLAGLKEGVLWGVGQGLRPITTPGTAPGTPAYMAPEQLDSEVTPQSDIYAWGLVYIECLTGRRAVEGTNDVDTLLKQVRDPVVLPAWLDAHPLGEILRRCTRKSTHVRYPDAQTVLADLRHCPMGELDASRAIIEIEDPDEDDEGYESLTTLPSLLVEELPSVPPPLPSAEDGGDLAELERLFEDYTRICNALGTPPTIGRDRFIQRARWEARALLDAHGSGTVRYRIVVDGEEVKLQPSIVE